MGMKSRSLDVFFEVSSMISPLGDIRLERSIQLSNRPEIVQLYTMFWPSAPSLQVSTISHFAYHHTVLICHALIYYFLTIAHFLQFSPSAHQIIFLGTFSVTFIGHPVFVFLLEISVDNRQIHSLGKIHNNRSFLISCSSTLPPIISSSTMFPSPTCPFRSAPRTILSCLDTLSINPFRLCAKSFFFYMLLLTCKAYTLTTYV